MKRRDFLKTGGLAGAAGLILDGCGNPQEIIPLLVSEDTFVPGEEGWVRTLCQQCSAGCGITVRVMQGQSIRTIDGQQKLIKVVQAKKIEGNPDHPISMGGTCARGQAGVQAVYHPDRVQSPLKLSGPRGSGQYQPITWKEAQQMLVTQLQQLQATPDALALLMGRRNRGTMGTVVERFAAGFGTMNLVSYDPFDPAPIRKALELTTGVAELPVVDFANANYLLSFNANLFETFLSPVSHMHAYGIFRQGRPGIRGKFVQAEPRLSQTAACADEWLPIRPGTEGLLALAMAHVIVAENLHDRDFIAQGTSGFAEWSATLASYAPATIAPQVDLPAEKIERIAREFAQRRPSVAVGDSRDVHALTAIYALNALVGAYGKKGGILPSSTAVSGPVPASAAAASAGPSSAARPGAARLGGPTGQAAPPAAQGKDILSFISTLSTVKALIVLDGNPLFTLPGSEKLRSALASVPFIASFSSFLDETAVMADLVLPNHHTLERWVDDVPEPGAGFPIRSLGQPVIEPRFDTRDSGDILIEAAKALGGNTAEALPFENFAAAVKESFRSVHALNAGSTVDADFDAFFTKVTAAGGWWNPPVAVVAVQGAESKAAPAPPRIQFVAPPAPVAARAFAGDPQQFPYALHLYPSAAFSDGRTAHLPWLQEMPDPMTTMMWSSWVELNPETAHKLDIHEGDILTVRSSQGSIDLPAYLYPGLRPEVISIPVGQGHTQYGRYAANVGANPLMLSAAALDQVSGAVLQTGVRVSVAKTGNHTELIKFGNSDARDHHEEPLHR